MHFRANELAAHLLEADEENLARDFIFGRTPEQLAAREAKAAAQKRKEDFFAQHDKKYSAMRAIGDVTPDTDAHYFWHRTLTYKDGLRPLQVRRSGKTQRWSSRPDEFRIPIKFGMYENGEITDRNASEWTTIQPPDKTRQR